jgi:hypothetical protein
MKDYLKILSQFKPATLDELESLMLLNRFDTKYILNEESLPEILEILKDDYQVLEIDGNREFSYDNLYYDTKEYFFFSQHHNGKLNRAKLRFRHYIDTNAQFFEIKRHMNNDLTEKTRIPIALNEKKINREIEEKILEKLELNYLEILPKLTVRYNRITLMNKEVPEKVTIDTDLYFKNTINDIALQGLTLLEIKHGCHRSASRLYNILKNMGLHPKSISKYCMGLVMTDSNVKYNRFKSKVLFINKILNERFARGIMF